MEVPEAAGALACGHSSENVPLVEHDEDGGRLGV